MEDVFAKYERLLQWLVEGMRGGAKQVAEPPSPPPPPPVAFASGGGRAALYAVCLLAVHVFHSHPIWLGRLPIAHHDLQWFCTLLDPSRTCMPGSGHNLFGDLHCKSLTRCQMRAGSLEQIVSCVPTRA